MKTILITGASGFLATHLAELLSDKDTRLVALVRNDNTTLSKKYDRVYTNVDELILKENKVDFVFHLASFIPSGNANEQSNEFIETNIDLTSKLVRAYWKARFIFASSVSVYGSPQSATVNIESGFDKPGLYGLSKLAGEAIVSNHPSHAIVRFSSIIGRGMKTHTFIPKILDQAKSGSIVLWGDGSRKQNYIDVRDAARLLMACSVGTGNIVTLGVGVKSYSNKEVAQLVAMKNKAEIKYQGVDESPSFNYDNKGAYEKLNFVPTYTLEQTISDLIDQPA